MPATIEEAVEYIYEYGNVKGPLESLKHTWRQAKIKEIREALAYMEFVSKRPRADIERCAVLLLCQ